MFLNPRRRGTRSLVGNPQAMHAAVMSAFPPHLTGNGRILWRVDEDADQLALYIVSPEVPSFEHIQEQAGWANQESWDIRPYTPLLERLVRGQRYAFRLTANPVRTVTDESGKKRRSAHVTAAQQQQWLQDRAEALGVKISAAGSEEQLDTPTFAVTSRHTRRFRRKGATVTMAQAQFDGVLEVSDVTKLTEALTLGVGKAKAHGCGLMTLAALN